MTEEVRPRGFEENRPLVSEKEEGASGEAIRGILARLAPSPDDGEAAHEAFGEIVAEKVSELCARARFGEAERCVEFLDALSAPRKKGVLKGCRACCEAAVLLSRLALLKDEGCAEEAADAAEERWREAFEEGGPFAGRIAAAIAAARLMLFDFPEAVEWAGIAVSRDGSPASMLVRAVALLAAAGSEDGEAALDEALAARPTERDLFYFRLLLDFLWPHSPSGKGGLAAEAFRERLREYLAANSGGGRSVS